MTIKDLVRKARRHDYIILPPAVHLSRCIQLTKERSKKSNSPGPRQGNNGIVQYILIIKYNFFIVDNLLYCTVHVRIVCGVVYADICVAIWEWTEIGCSSFERIQPLRYNEEM